MVSTLFFILLAAPAPCPPLAAAELGCADAVEVMEGGCPVRRLCPADAVAQGFTLLDLSDQWTPTILTEDPSLGEAGKQLYRDNYLKLANGQVTDRSVEERARTDRFLEPYGIFPNFSVLRDRLADEARHACRQAVVDEGLRSITRTLSPYEDAASQKQRVKSVAALEAQFTRELVKRAKAQPFPGPPPPPDDFESLAGEKKWAASIAKWKKLRMRVEAIRAMQEHLRCDGLSRRPDAPGLFGYDTQVGLEMYQRKQMLGSRSHLDLETRDTLIEDSHELDFQALLRALRERVANAGGLIEDGSALGRWGQVLGRTLDSSEYRFPLPDVPLPNGAEDFISPATEAAARALGWTAPEDATARMVALGADAFKQPRVVAIKLPPPPPWHSAHMDLRAEVDRGDVWYDYPVTASGRLRTHRIERRPTTTLFVRYADRDIPLVRWPTTIGSWKDERLEDGSLVYKYKNSDVGPRIWRSLIASPTWLPPPSTPEEDMARSDGAGGYEAKTELFGPSYASAYGLVMLIHNKPVERKNGTIVYYDNGIRTHGSVSYRSIVRGASHGCHRLFNHLAVRLADFLLEHRPYTREGRIPAGYARTFSYKGDSVTLKIPDRGYGFLLDPPVPVEVLEGRIRSGRKKPPAGSFPAP